MSDKFISAADKISNTIAEIQKLSAENDKKFMTDLAEIKQSILAINEKISTMEDSLKHLNNMIKSRTNSQNQPKTDQSAA